MNVTFWGMNPLSLPEKEEENLRKYIKKVHKFYLSEVAGEGETDCLPQKFLSSQQFRHFMRCTKHVNKICLSCLFPEIQLFVYILAC